MAPISPRRRPGLGTLHRVVRENIETLYAAVEGGELGVFLPSFVRRELEPSKLQTSPLVLPTR